MQGGGGVAHTNLPNLRVSVVEELDELEFIVRQEWEAWCRVSYLFQFSGHVGRCLYILEER